MAALEGKGDVEGRFVVVRAREGGETRPSVANIRGFSKRVAEKSVRQFTVVT
jgi:hypothetical protein